MRKLGIIGAMKEEVALLQEKLERPAVTRRAGMDFWDGVLCGLPVTVVQSGIGKVNAALCVQVLADLYGVTHVVNTGVAGSLDPALDIGDVAISSEAMYQPPVPGGTDCLRRPVYLGAGSERGHFKCLRRHLCGDGGGCHSPCRLPEPTAGGDCPSHFRQGG